MSIDIRKVLKYPPESFVSAVPMNLVAGDNKVAEYSGFDPYILVIQGLSFRALDGGIFHLDVDGYTDMVKLDDLSSVKGLDFEELIKIPVTRRATFRITTTANVTAYQWRHRVTVFKPSVILKLQLGLPLSGYEAELVSKYGLDQALRLYNPEPYNIHSGVEVWKSVSVKLSSSGVVTRVLTPKDMKVILTGVSATRPAEPASAYLNIFRDDVEVMSLDLYCLPSLSYEVPLRVVALNKLDIFLDVRKAGTYYVRVTYGLGRLTLRDKISWGLDLKAEERAEAEEKDLFNKVLAGVV